MVTQGERNDISGYGGTAAAGEYGSSSTAPSDEPVASGSAIGTSTAVRPTTRASMRGMREESVLSLVGGMARDLGVLVRQEASLLRVELGEKLDVLKQGLASVASGGLVTFAGVIFVILAAVLALDEALDAPWLSALIVGGIVTLIGLALLGRGRAKLSASSMVPERSARSLQKDVGLAKEEMHELRRNPS